MRRARLLIVAGGAAPLLLVACGGNVFTTASGGDGGPDGANENGGSAGKGTGGRTGTGGRSTGGRGTGGFLDTGGLLGAGGIVGTGGFQAGGAAGFPGTGGAAGACGLDCSYLNAPCRTGVCLGGSCTVVTTPDGYSCDDGSLCTTGDTCRSGVCAGAAPPPCPAPAQCYSAACDPTTGKCASKPMDGGSCNDGNGCTTSDTCVAGVCTGTPVGCVSGDGCCPASCAGTMDSDCASGCANIALNAVATHSGGGSGTLGPAAMNDGVGEPTCSFTWVQDSTTPMGAWMQLTWTDTVTIGSIYIETDNASAPECTSTGPRNLASGRVQYQNGGQWADVASFGGFTDDVRVDFSTPVTTTALRVYDMTATPPGYNSIVYEWHVYKQAGCKPPP